MRLDRGNNHRFLGGAEFMPRTNEPDYQLYTDSVGSQAQLTSLATALAWGSLD